MGVAAPRGHPGLAEPRASEERSVHHRRQHRERPGGRGGAGGLQAAQHLLRAGMPLRRGGWEWEGRILIWGVICTKLFV